MAATPTASKAGASDQPGGAKRQSAIPVPKKIIYKQGELKKQGGYHGGWKTWKKRSVPVKTCLTKSHKLLIEHKPRRAQLRTTLK